MVLWMTSSSAMRSSDGVFDEERMASRWEVHLDKVVDDAWWSLLNRCTGELFITFSTRFSYYCLVLTETAVQLLYRLKLMFGSFVYSMAPKEKLRNVNWLEELIRGTD